MLIYVCGLDLEAMTLATKKHFQKIMLIYAYLLVD